MSKKRSRPLYVSTAELLAEILRKTEPGSYLPSEPKLAKQLGVSRATLREAMRPFEERGMIVRRQGVGTYVTEPPHVIETGLDALNSIESLAENLDIPVEMHALQITERQPDRGEGQILSLGSEQSVLEISRVIQTEARPAAYLIDVIPTGLLSFDKLQDGFKGSVLDLFLRQGFPELECSSTEIKAVSASAEIARLLNIQRGDVLLLMESRLQTISQMVIDLSSSYFIPGIFRFNITRQIGGMNSPKWSVHSDSTEPPAGLPQPLKDSET
jgi:GntR family transcriptional regulator